MNKKDPAFIVKRFNDFINDRDIDSLTALMSESHIFIDSSDEIHRGVKVMTKEWMDFFKQFPDYQNHFTYVETRGNLVLILGYSTCSYNPLNGPAIWTAKVDNDLVSEWRVYMDTPGNREKLKIASTV
jgi:ketosteroid isomerase-like protein